MLVAYSSQFSLSNSGTRGEKVNTAAFESSLEVTPRISKCGIVTNGHEALAKSEADVRVLLKLRKAEKELAAEFSAA